MSKFSMESSFGSGVPSGMTEGEKGVSGGLDRDREEDIAEQDELEAHIGFPGSNEDIMIAERMKSEREAIMNAEKRALGLPSEKKEE